MGTCQSSQYSEAQPAMAIALLYSLPAMYKPGTVLAGIVQPVTIWAAPHRQLTSTPKDKSLVERTIHQLSSWHLSSLLAIRLLIALLKILGNFLQKGT